MFDGITFGEATADYRTRGVNWRVLGPDLTRPLSARMPVCFAQRRDFKADYVSRSVFNPNIHDISESDVLSLIDDERECETSPTQDGFVPWVQGFTPKEHRESLDRQRMSEQDAEREKDRRRFEETLVDKASRPQKWLVALSIIALGVALVSAIVPLLDDDRPVVNNYIDGTPP